MISAVDEAMEFIKKNIRLEYQFTGELQRKDHWQYPLPALREILLNSIIHKDYRNPTDIIIKIFDDSIMFSNPGGLMGGLTIEDLKTDNYQAKHRNCLLSEAFYLMGQVEKYGTGFIRIRKYLIDYPELCYTIQNLNDFIRIIVRSNKDVPKDAPKDAPKDDTINVTKEERLKMIIALIKENPGITQPTLAKKFNVDLKTIKRDMEILKAHNKINRIGGRKNGYWKIIEK